MKIRNQMKTTMSLAAAMGSMALSTQHATAALISINPATGVTSSTELPNSGPVSDRINDHVVDGSGLTGLAHDNGGGNGTMWLTSGGTQAYGPKDADPWIEFDLGAVYTIDSIRVWNMNHSANTDRGVKDLAIEYGNTAALGSTLAGVTQFAQASGLSTYEGEIFDSGDFTSFQARFIRFEIVNDANRNWGDDDFTGLSEVQFSGVAVPEPTTTALLGLGGLALILRRRK